MKFAICDLETTGLGTDSQIIEIAIIVVEDGKIVDSFQSLVNPLTKVSETVLSLTGISQRQLDSSPKFYDLAPTILHLLEGNTFVSHKVDFDFQVLDHHLSSLGHQLKVKTFCTLKKGQELIPGLASYSLDAMCAFFNIKVKDRHRAWPDALLCFEVFKQLNHLLVPKTTELYLPHHLEILKKISRGPGILSLKNKDQKVIYSKACYDVYETAKEELKYKFIKRNYLSKIHSAEFKMTRSELLAHILLMQQSPLKHHWGLYLKKRKNGLKVLYVDKLKRRGNLLWSHSSKNEVYKKLNTLSTSKNQDYVYRGDLLSKDAIVQRNIELTHRLKNIQFPYSDILISFDGSHLDEIEFILVRGYSVRGKGVVHKNDWGHAVLNPERYLTSRWPYSAEINQIVKNYLISLKNNKYKKESIRVLSAKPTIKRESYESKEI